MTSRPGAFPPNVHRTDEVTIDALVILSFEVQTILQGAADAEDLSLVQVRLLGILRDRQPSMLEVARVLRLTKSAVTGLVDRAEARGLVHRLKDPVDGRGVLVALTAAGHERVKRATSRIHAQLNALLEALNPAQQQVLQALATQVISAANPSLKDALGG